MPSNLTKYDHTLHPPFTDDTIHTKESLPISSIGRRISKRFHDGIYPGTITATWIDNDNTQQYTIKYDDDDSEDITASELIECIDLYKLYPNEHRYSGIPSNAKDLPLHPNAPPQPDNFDSKWKDQLSDTPSCEKKYNSDQQTTTDHVDRGDISLDADNRGVNTFPRRSSRIKKKGKKDNFRHVKHLAKLGLVMFKASAVMSHSMDLPPLSFPGVDLTINHANVLPHTEPIDHIEELRAYHSQVNKLNDMFNPDPHNPMWQPETIVSHHVRKHTKEISLKIHYPENHAQHLVKLENLRLDEPWMCIRYAA